MTPSSLIRDFFGYLLGTTTAAGVGRNGLTLSLQVSTPQNCDGVAIVKRLIFRILVTGPDVILLRRPALTVLLDPRFPFEDVADVADHGTMGFIIGGPAVFDPGCIMTSRIKTVLNPGMSEEVAESP
jgi:hypothetical protein